jgi:predicted ATP-grasp superfamily ATP-dependent carboligase
MSPTLTTYRQLRNLPQFGRPPAIVVGVNWTNGLGLVRDLGEEGVPVLGLDPSPDAIGFVSRYATGLVCPDPGNEPDAFLTFMDALGRRLSRPGVVFLTRDQDVVTASVHREALERHFHLPFAGWEVVAKIVDKRGQYAAAEEIGIPLPQTHFPESEGEVEQLADHLPYPVLVKPTYHVDFGEEFKVKGLLASAPSELLPQYRRAARFGVMIQEVIPGDAGQLYTLGSYIDRAGQPLGLFTGRKLRQVPRVFGISRASESVSAPVVVEQGLRLLKALGFWGISQVEFKLDPRDGRYKLMEINSRSYSWQRLATLCGVNLAYIAYRDALGEPPSPIRSEVEGRCWVMLPIDLLMTPPEIVRGHVSLRSWVDSLRRIAATGVFSRDDPRPGWRYLVQRVRRPLRAVGG